MIKQLGILSLIWTLSACQGEGLSRQEHLQLEASKQELGQAAPLDNDALAVESFDPAKTATFSWFEYQGMDEVFAKPLAKGEFQNPVAAGFYPDPSITRKGDDYYMAVSSFSYAPGVPILHSRDLANWQLVGHALTRPSQLKLEGQQTSRGVFAPTLRYHNGLFYMITTAVEGGGNFFVTAEDPAGQWSEPYWLPEVIGIDPDIFFDDDGRVYIAHNGEPEGEALYEGHRAIWLWEYDLVQKQIVKDSGRVIVNGGVDLSAEPIWIEAPHIYKIDGWYYLLCAEGGTAYNHSEVVFRTRSLDQPFVPYEGNPILTQRDLDIDRANPITTAGHADIVQTLTGEWWAVFLATRAYDKTYFNSGRETFLLPVTWRDGWPHILPQGEVIPHRLAAPNPPADIDIAEPLTGNFTWRDEFEVGELNKQWNLLRGFDSSWFHQTNGQMKVQALPVYLEALQQPAFLSRRQQHMNYRASTELQLPESKQFSAGIVAHQNRHFHYYLGVKKQDEGYQVFVEKAQGGAPVVIAHAEINPTSEQAIELHIHGNKSQIDFSYQLGDEFIPLVKGEDGKLLSTEVAKGFVGTMLGIHSRLEL